MSSENGNSTITLYETDVTNFINNSSNSTHFKNHIISYLKKEFNYVLLKGLNSNQRHLIYKQMVHPLKFEKIKENENVTIKIFIYEKTEEDLEDSEDSEDSEDLEDSEDQDDESYVPTEETEEESEDEELEYNNEKINREYLQLILDIQSKTVNKLETIEQNANKIIRRTNILIMIGIIGWGILFTYDPVKLVITN